MRDSESFPNWQMQRCTKSNLLDKSKKEMIANSFTWLISLSYRDLKAAKLEKEISNTTIVSIIEEKLPKLVR